MLRLLRHVGMHKNDRIQAIHYHCVILTKGKYFVGDVVYFNVLRTGSSSN